jgi:predicted Ser/Thr protein kinase
MPKYIAGISENELLEWIKASVGHRKNILSHGYQGYTYVFNRQGQRLVVKVPMGGGPAWLIRRWMLANEYRVYQLLAGMKGIPACHGFIRKRYLILEFVDGVSIRDARIVDKDFFFNALLQLIKDMHAAGVAHGDLKKKDNILVINGKQPCVVDFGVAVIKKKGLAPINRYLYGLFQRFDYNAWAKLKYNGQFENMSADDRQYYHRTVVEKAASWIKRNYVKIKKALLQQ